MTVLKQIVRTVYRSAIDGKFVSKAYATANPNTTVTHQYTLLVHSESNE